MDWQEIFKYMVSLGLAGIIVFVVLYLLFKYFENKINNMDKGRQEQIKQTENIIAQNNELIKYIMNNTKEMNTELKLAIDNLATHIEKSQLFYDNIISEITDEIKGLNDEISGLREQYVKVTAQIIEALLDDKYISKRTFYELTRLYLVKYVYKCLININNFFDANGLTTADKITLLRENIIREMERHIAECKVDIQALNYDKDKIEIFFTKAYEMRIKHMNTITDILDNMTLETLSKDEHYYTTKQMIRNRMYEFLEKVQDVLKETLNEIKKSHRL